MKNINWLLRIEELRPGDACEVYTQLSTETDARGYSPWGWVLATVRKNGGSYYWRVLEEVSRREYDVWIEHVRLPGQTEAWPGRG